MYASELFIEKFLFIKLIINLPPLAIIYYLIISNIFINKSKIICLKYNEFFSSLNNKVIYIFYLTNYSLLLHTEILSFAAYLLTHICL